MHVNAKQEIYHLLRKWLKECNASEDFFEPVRAMLMKRENVTTKFKMAGTRPRAPWRS